MLLALAPVPLAELPVAEPVALPVPALLPVAAPAAEPFGRIRPVISTWLFTYSFSLSFWLPPTIMNLSPMALVVPEAGLPVAELVGDPLVPEAVPPDMDAEPLPIFAFARMY